MSHFLLGYYRIEKSDEGDMKYTLFDVGDTMDPYDIKVPKPLDDWIYPDINTENREPTFNKFDNKELM